MKIRFRKINVKKFIFDFKLLQYLSLTLFLFGVINTSIAADVYPNKPIRLVLGYAPGGVADITARLVAQKMSEILEQQVIVDNRPSAGGIVAGEVVAASEHDGYTLLHMNYGNAVSAAIFKKLPYDIKTDFEPISAMGFFDIVMLVDGKSEISSIQNFIAKARAQPYKYNIGSVSVGSGQHMAALLFKSMLDLPVEIVPYKSTSALFMALQAKDIELAFEVISPSIPLIKAGSITAIGVSSSKRNVNLPSVPTLSESGVKGYEVVAWNGIAAPAKTPKVIIERLNKAVNLALSKPDIKSKFQELGIEAKGGSPEEFRSILLNEINKWNKLVATMQLEKQ